MNNNVRRILLVAGLSSLFTGCISAPHKAYEGPDRKPEEIATIKWVYTGNNGFDGITVKKVDSKDLPSFTNSNRVNVLPGSHKLYVKCTGYKYKPVTDGEIELSVEAGKMYVLYGKHKTAKLEDNHGRQLYHGVEPHSCYAKVKQYETRK
ncbi:MAG: hypothetical protein GWO26_23475 [Phycisphaerae bacterium]|nr:hypothetical protein [Phycisphaerae bacterium]